MVWRAWMSGMMSSALAGTMPPSSATSTQILSLVLSIFFTRAGTVVVTGELLRGMSTMVVTPGARKRIKLTYVAYRQMQQPLLLSQSLPKPRDQVRSHAHASQRRLVMELSEALSRAAAGRGNRTRHNVEGAHIHHVRAMCNRMLV